MKATKRKVSCAMSHIPMSPGSFHCSNLSLHAETCWDCWLQAHHPPPTSAASPAAQSMTCLMCFIQFYSSFSCCRNLWTGRDFYGLVRTCTANESSNDTNKYKRHIEKYKMYQDVKVTQDIKSAPVSDASRRLAFLQKGVLRCCTR